MVLTDGSDHDRQPAADLLNQPPKEGDRDDATETLRAIEDAELRTRWVIEVGLPVRQGLQSCTKGIESASFQHFVGSRTEEMPASLRYSVQTPCSFCSTSLFLD